jgi:regulator of protease activity HflC (stomatin/prohibitin superfamily)
MEIAIIGGVTIGLIFLTTLVYSSITSVSPGNTKALYIMGQFRGVLSEGYHLTTPFISDLRSVNTKIRETEIPRQTVLSADGVQISVSVTVYVKVSDVKKFIESVDDLDGKIWTIGKSQVRTVLSDYESQDIPSNRRKITDDIESEVSDAVSDWGVEIHRIELTDLKVNN